MIFASTVVLALAVSSVPAALGAPIGRRDFDVRALRRSMESAPAPLEARAVVPEHHSARSYVEGGKNDPRAIAPDAGNSDINKREEPKSWRRERAKDEMPRHVRDVISRKRAAAVETRQANPPTESAPKARSEEDKVETREEKPAETREEKPRSVNTPTTPEPGTSKPETREEPTTVDRREALDPITTWKKSYKRALEGLD